MSLDREQLEARLNDTSLDRERFDLLIASLLEKDWGAKNIVLEQKGGFTFFVENTQETHTIFTENIWTECHESDEPRCQVVQTFLRKVMSPRPEQFEKEQIVAIVRDSEWLAVDQKEFVIKEHLAGDLWIVYAIDYPEMTSAITRDQIAEKAINASELRALAVSNLQRLLPTIEWRENESQYLLTADGCYEASLLLVDDIWPELAAMVQGDLVASVPSRDALLFTGSNSREGLKLLRERTDRYFHEGHHRVSKTLLRRVGGKWIVY